MKKPRGNQNLFISLSPKPSPSHPQQPPQISMSKSMLLPKAWSKCPVVNLNPSLSLSLSSLTCFDTKESADINNRWSTTTSSSSLLSSSATTTPTNRRSINQIMAATAKPHLYSYANSYSYENLNQEKNEDEDEEAKAENHNQSQSQIYQRRKRRNPISSLAQTSSLSSWSSASQAESVAKRMMKWAIVTVILTSVLPIIKADSGAITGWDRPTGMPKIAHLEVMCGAQHMEVHLAFDSAFHGLVASKGMYGHEGCVYVPPRTGQNTFVFNIYYDKCGTKPDNHGKFYENTVVVQYDEELIEAWDEAKRLRCEWFNDYEKTATKTSPMVISDLEIVELNFHGDNVDCWMEIQEGKGPWAPPLNGIVPLGSTLTMVVAVKDPTGEFDMRVKACEASDGQSGHILPLSDTEGCIIRPKLIGKFSKLKLDDGRATVLTYAFLSAFKFPDMLNVHLRCTVEICRHGCPDHCTAAYAPPKNALDPHGEYSAQEPLALQSETSVKEENLNDISEDNKNHDGDNGQNDLDSLPPQKPDIHELAEQEHLSQQQQFEQEFNQNFPGLQESTSAQGLLPPLFPPQEGPQPPHFPPPTGPPPSHFPPPTGPPPSHFPPHNQFPPGPHHSGEVFNANINHMQPPPPFFQGQRHPMFPHGRPGPGGRPHPMMHNRPPGPYPQNYPPPPMIRYPVPPPQGYNGPPQRFTGTIQHTIGSQGPPDPMFMHQQQQHHGQRLQNMMMKPEPKIDTMELNQGVNADGQPQLQVVEIMKKSNSDENDEMLMEPQSQALKGDPLTSRQGELPTTESEETVSVPSVFPKGPRRLRLRREVSSNSDVVGVQGAFRVISQADLNFALNATSANAPPTVVLRGKMARPEELVYGICLPRVSFGVVFFGLGLATLVAILIAAFLALTHYRVVQHFNPSDNSDNSMPVPPGFAQQMLPMVIFRKMW